MLRRLRGRVLALALLSLVPPAAAAEPVALTFDDLPTLSLTDAPDYARTTTARLVKRLRRHRIPAIGFVVGDKLEGDPTASRAMLETWLNAGFELGNHTYSHPSLNHAPATDYLADIQRDDDLLRPLLAAHGASPRWFRHPYLETGATLADMWTVQSWLALRGYRIAPVTLEASDYMFALPYDEAILRGDKPAARAVKAAYLDYTAKSVAWYRGAALQLLGRRPALVFLLHASRLNADSVDELAAILRHNHLRPVSLETAMRDPAYALPDDHADPDGDEWLTRWSQTLGRPLPWSTFAEPPADIAAANDRLDTAP